MPTSRFFSGVPSLSFPVYCSFALIVFSVGACSPKPKTGIYIECDSNGDNLYYIWINNSIDCEALYGSGVTNCYYPENAENIAHCYESEEWLAAGEDTGEAEENEGIHRNEWPIHEPSLTYIKDHCTERCSYFHNPLSGEVYDCEDNDWVIFGKEGNSHVEADQLQDPGALTCWPWYAEANKSHIDPGDTFIITSGSPQWPSDNAYLVSACSDFETCGNLFDENVMGHLVKRNMDEIVDNESEADYLLTSAVGSSSSLTFKIHNPPPINTSQESNWVGGRMEYTALDCGSSTCPFYLGNLTLTNTTDTWDLYSDAESDDVDIENVVVRLRRPVLGLWRPSTGEIFIGDKMLDLRVDLDITIGGGSPTSVTQHGTNAGEIFGEVSALYTIEFTNLVITAGDMEAEADLDYNTVDGEPPVASLTLGPVYDLPSGISTLQLSNIPNGSADPDSDLDYELWIVDGNQVASTHQMGVGGHTVRLEVRDSRYAYDYYEKAITIIP